MLCFLYITVSGIIILSSKSVKNYNMPNLINIKPEIVVFKMDILMFWYWVASFFTRYTICWNINPRKELFVTIGRTDSNYRKASFLFSTWRVNYCVFVVLFSFLLLNCLGLEGGALKRDGQQIVVNYIQDEQILDVAGRIVVLVESIFLKNKEKKIKKLLLQNYKQFTVS